MRSWNSRPTPPCMLLAGALALLMPGLAAAQPATTRVSVGSGAVQSNHPSVGPSISDNGRWVAFDSSASNLVPGDTNDTQDVFLHDRQTGTTTRLSVGPGGVEGNAVSRSPEISGDGRWVAFVSFATTLIVDDTNHVADVFVYDRHAGTLARVSVGPGGVEGDMDSDNPTISPDGRWVAFSSLATNLVADDANAESDVFVHDRQTGITARVSVGPGGAESDAGSGWPAISADGRWVAFTSMAANLVPDDTNDQIDTFVHDRQTGATTLVSVGPAGVQGDGMSWGTPSISGDGQRVVFQSAASNLVPGDTNGEHDVFVRDLQAGTTTRVSLGPGGLEGDSWSEFPVISADGRWVVFDSASPMVAGDDNHEEDVFAYDLQTGTMTRVSLGPGGIQGNGGSFFQSISADGRWVAFTSWASNLVAGDTNGYGDIFVRDLVVTTPMPPSELVVHSVAGNLVTLRWTSPGFGPAPTAFVIEGGTAPGEVLASFSTGSTAPTFTFAAPAGSFYVRVHTVSGSFRSGSSNEVRVHVNVPLVPSAPAHLLALVNGSTVTLVWQNTYAGGAPTSFVLDVTGTITASIPLGFGDTFTLANVPDGRYTLALRARNASGLGPPSNAHTLSFPGPCSGPPTAPTNVFAYQVDGSAHVSWAPGTSGSAPTAYVLIVTGAWTGTFVTTDRDVSGTLGSGAYTLSIVAINPCGASAATSPQTVVVP
jgi:Tol biopolymer transport system component